MLANAENLKGRGFDSRSTSEVREIARKGGQKSGESRRRKRTWQQTVKACMEMEAAPAFKKRMEYLGIDEDDMTYQASITSALIQKAATDGDPKSIEFLREFTGEDPKQKMHKEELKLKREELKLRREELELKKAELEYKKSQGLSLDDNDEESKDAVVLYVPDNGLGDMENKE